MERNNDAPGTIGMAAGTRNTVDGTPFALAIGSVYSVKHTDAIKKAYGVALAHRAAHKIDGPAQQTAHASPEKLFPLYVEQQSESHSAAERAQKLKQPIRYEHSHLTRGTKAGQSPAR